MIINTKPLLSPGNFELKIKLTLFKSINTNNYNSNNSKSNAYRIKSKSYINMYKENLNFLFFLA